MTSVTCLDTSESSTAFTIGLDPGNAAAVLSTMGAESGGSIRYTQCTLFRVDITAQTRARDYFSTCSVIVQIQIRTMPLLGIPVRL